jgi:predicted nucleotidyltransferase
MNTKQHVNAKSVPALLPIFRSQSQALVLSCLLANEGGRSLSEISQKTGVAPESVRREVDLLESAGITSSHFTGRNRTISVCATEPLLGILTDLVMYSYGALEIIQEELKGVAGIELAFIYGSWASRYLRNPGRIPNDIDLLIVGKTDRDTLFGACDRAAERIGKEVNPHSVSPESWANPEGEFLKSVKELPIIPVHIG